ncbi:MAG: AAA family ATPase [bacterium]|nr:AAA family ATPase [bacterium]
MIQFPYGIADFQSIRREGMFYLDRTAGIRDVERLGRTLVFLRPRRFGKSLWLQTLATCYDLRLTDEFDALFDGLDAGREPTPKRKR